MADSQMFSPTDKTTPGAYNASQTALLLLDFHNLFIGKSPGSDASKAVACAAAAATWARSNGIQVIHCLLDMSQAPFPTCKGYDRFAGIVNMMKQANDTEPSSLLDGGDKDVTFTRRPGHVSALRSPGLREFLREKGIVSLILAGLSTSGCVCRTAFAAADEEFVVTVLSDGCADPQDGLHGVMVDKLLANRGYVVSLEEFKEGFERAGGK